MFVKQVSDDGGAKPFAEPLYGVAGLSLLGAGDVKREASWDARSMVCFCGPMFILKSAIRILSANSSRVGGLLEAGI